MATKNGRKQVTLGEIITTATTAPEVDLIGTSDPEELVFEGGDLDGQRMTVHELEKSVRPESVEKPAEEKTPETPKAETEETPDPAIPEETPEGEEAKEEAEETTEASEEGKRAEDQKSEGEEYKPNFSYRVYDQDKQFPDWAQKVVTSKETEENLRATLQKSEAFDVLKPKHETVVRERDEAKGHVQDHVGRVQELLQLRDTKPHLFFAKLGVSDDFITRYAADVIRATDTEEGAAALRTKRASEADEYNRQRQEATDRATQQSSFADAHAQNMSLTFTLPHVQDFRTKFGVEQFDRTYQLVGSQMLSEAQGRYVHPMQVYERVVQQYGNLPHLMAPQVVTPAPQSASTTAPATPTQTQPATQSNGAPAQAKPQHVRPKTLPNLGKGQAGASPVKSRPRSLDEVKSRAEAELSGG